MQVVPQASIHPVVPTIGIILGESPSQDKTTEEQAPLAVQTPAPAPVPTEEQVTIHNIATDSDQDDEPIAVVARKRKGETKQRQPIEVHATPEVQEKPEIQVQPMQVHVQMMDEEGYEEHDERMVLTP